MVVKVNELSIHFRISCDGQMETKGKLTKNYINSFSIKFCSELSLIVQQSCIELFTISLKKLRKKTLCLVLQVIILFIPYG